MRIARTPRVALVGIGRFGKNHLRVLRGLHRVGEIEFAGVVGRTPRRARQIAGQFGVRAYPSLEHVLREGVDAVDVVTPARTHAAIVRRCLREAHVFVEKPLAPTLEESVQLYRLARRHSRLLAVGHIFRFNAAVARVASMLSRRSSPYLIRIELTGWSRPPGDVGAIVTYLHVFDLLDTLLEARPLSTTCLARMAGFREGLERHAVVVVQYPRGLIAILEVGWIGGEKRRRLEVLFPDLSVRCDLARQVIELHRPARQVEVLRLYRKEPLRLELEHFFRSIRWGTGLRPTPAAVLRVMRMVRDAETSARLRRPIRWLG